MSLTILSIRLSACYCARDWERIGMRWRQRFDDWLAENEPQLLGYIILWLTIALLVVVPWLEN